MRTAGNAGAMRARETLQELKRARDAGDTERSPYMATVIVATGSTVTVRDSGDDVGTEQSELLSRMRYFASPGDKGYVLKSQGGAEIFVPTGLPTEQESSIWIPPGLQVGDGSLATTAVQNSTRARYLGKCPFDITGITFRYEVMTAVSGTITWAEVGLGTSSSFTPGLAADISRRQFANVAAVANSIGIKDTTLSINIGRGEHLWFLWGSSTTVNALSVRGGIADMLSSGLTQLANSTRISTMATPTTFTVSASAASSPWVYFWLVRA